MRPRAGLLGMLLVVKAIIGSAEMSFADHKICIGQFRGNCPALPVDGFYACPSSREEVAQKICTVYKDGTETKLGYRTLDVAPPTGSGTCKYQVFRVFCVSN